MAKMDDLRDLYHHMMKDAYSAEKQLVEAMPKMIEAASSSNLKQALEAHLEETRRHFEAVRAMLDEMDVNPGNKVCVGMEGLIKEGDELVKKKGQIDNDVLDAGLITAAQKAEHYEISEYGSLREFASAIGMDNHAQQLNQILDDEYEADRKLSKLAEGGLNWEALAG